MAHLRLHSRLLTLAMAVGLPAALLSIQGPLAGSAAGATSVRASKAPVVAHSAEPEPGPVPELSTETSNTVREADGSYTTEISAGPMNFKDESGDWVPISNELVEAPGAAYAVENEGNSYTVSIPENPAITPVKFEENGDWVTMKLVGADDVEPDVEGAEATFENIAGADEIVYKATDRGVKETIVLNTPAVSAPSYTYTLRVSPGITPVLTGAEAVEFRDDSGAVQFVIPPGFMEDSATPEPAYSTDVDYTLIQTGSSWRFTITPSPAWLADAARVYPVLVDPTVDKIVQKSCWMQEEQPTATHCGEWIVKVGANENLKKRRGLFDFNLNGIPSTAAISNATAYIWADHYSTSGSSTGMPNWALYNPSQSWKQGATWNNAWSDGGLVMPWTGGGSLNQVSQSTVPSNGSASGWMSWDITSRAQGWVNSPSANPNRGVLLRQTNENVRKVLGLVSETHDQAWARPLLRVTYSTPSPPTIGSLSVSPGGSGYTTSATPLLSATVADSDTASLSVTFKAVSPSGQIAWSQPVPAAAGSTASQSVAAGKLKPGVTYTFSATVSDGSGNATASSVIQVDTAAPVTASGPCASPCQLLGMPRPNLFSGSVAPAGVVNIPVSDPSFNIALAGELRFEITASGSPVTLYDPDIAVPKATTVSAGQTKQVVMWASRDSTVRLTNPTATAANVTLRLVGWTPWETAAEVAVEAAENASTDATPAEEAEIFSDEVADLVQAQPLSAATKSAYAITGSDPYRGVNVTNGEVCSAPQNGTTRCMEWVSSQDYETSLYTAGPQLRPGETVQPQSDYGTAETTSADRQVRAPNCPRYPNWRTRRFEGLTCEWHRVVDRLVSSGEVTGKSWLFVKHEVVLHPKNVNADISMDVYYDRGWGTATYVPFTLRAQCQNCTSSNSVAFGGVGEPNQLSTSVAVQVQGNATAGGVQLNLVSSFEFEYGPQYDLSDNSTYIAPRLRCDDAVYLPDAGGGGCVFEEAIPEFVLSLTGNYPESAAHIYDAQGFLVGHPGSAALGGAPLNRKYWYPTETNKNRKDAKKQCIREGIYGQPGKDCDEYAFASTEQGCHYDGCSTRAIDASDNRGAGSRLGHFYRLHRIMDGNPFWVTIKS